jgi:hypothetical protein
VEQHHTRMRPCSALFPDILPIIGQTLISAFFQALFCLHLRHKHSLQEVKRNPHVHVHMSSTTV